jgi:hypothetical protein
MQPPVTLKTLDDKFLFHITFLTRWTVLQGCARCASRIIVLPGAGAVTGTRRSAILTGDAPLAFPRAGRHLVKRRVEAINMEGYIAFITKDQTGLVMWFAAALTHRAIQTTPTFREDDGI